MCDFDPNYTFPASPPRTLYNPHFSNSQDPLKQRPLSFSPQTKPRRHAHRRSAAMSEDLNPAEVAQLLSPKPIPIKQPSQPQPLLTPPVSQSAPTTNNFLPTPKFEDEMFEDMRPTEAPFLFTLNSKHLKEVGEPGQIMSTKTISPCPSPMKKDSQKRKKRRSFVQLLKRTNSGGPNGTGGTDENAHKHSDDDCNATLTPSSLPRTPESTPKPLEFGVSPLGIPNFDLDPEPQSFNNLPRIDLNEALSCSFEHRSKPKELVSESPFSKVSSVIGPVLEEGDEYEDQQNNRHSDLARQSSLSSTLSSPRTPRIYKTGYSLPGSPTRMKGSAMKKSKPIDVPESSGSGSGSGSNSGSNPGKLMSKDLGSDTALDQISNLAIMDPKPIALEGTRGSVPSTPKNSGSKNLRRKRSLMDKLTRR